MNRKLLTIRERQVLNYTMDGMHDGDIGKSMGISPRTVKAHKARMYIKYDIGEPWSKLIRLVYLFSKGEVA